MRKRAPNSALVDVWHKKLQEQEVTSSKARKIEAFKPYVKIFTFTVEDSRAF